VVSGSVKSSQWSVVSKKKSMDMIGLRKLEAENRKPKTENSF